MAGTPAWTRFAGTTAAELAAFVAAARPGGPVRVSLEGDAWGPDAGRALAALPPGVDLRVVFLRGTRVGDEGLMALAASPALATVRSLGVERSGLTDRGVAALAASPNAAGLAALYLCNRDGVTTGEPNAIGDAAALALAGSPHLDALEELDLWNTGVGDDGLTALLASPHLPRLRAVTAWGTPLTAAGATRAKALAAERRERLVAAGKIPVWCAVHTDHDQRSISYSDEY